MRGRSTSVAYCHDVTCQGSSGITATYTGDTWTEPGWWEPEECPHCGGELHDERLDFEDAMEALGEALEESGALDVKTLERNDVDWREVYSVVQAELDRQRAQWRKAEREAAARQAEIDRLIAAGELEPERGLPF